MAGARPSRRVAAARLASATVPPAPTTPAPEESARAAGLRYVSDQQPGIRRRKAGTGFTYVGPDGRTVKDRDALARIRRLAVPPAWTDVWICPDPRGHLQATGRDARGRKQYRYHPGWRRTRDDTKYGRMMAFGKALPAIRRRVEEDMARPGLPREKVIATLVRLLETTFIRVGNEEYARENRSYGLTTLRDQHVQVDGAKLRFRFRGKGGKTHEVDLQDPRLARIVKRCQDLPGQELFQYEDEDGEPRTVSSQDVNDYLREVSGQDFTAKDFRTWAGTVLAALALQEMEAATSRKVLKANVVRAIERVAERLGNTPAICRKCYVHPAILDGYLDGTLLDSLQRRVRQHAADPHALTADEAAVLGLLERRLEREGDPKALEKRLAASLKEARKGGRKAAAPSRPPGAEAARVRTGARR